MSGVTSGCQPGPSPDIGPLRILAVSQTWAGANDYSFVRAFRRAGHSVSVVSDEGFFPPGWRHPVLRAIRRLVMPLLVADYQQALLDAARQLQPDFLFVFKGTFVEPATIRAIKAMGVVAINFYPDIGIATQGRRIAGAMALYDWVFTTKSFRIADMQRDLGVSQASFIPHAYDPEIHAPVVLDARDRELYGCEVAFIGTWTPKKEAMMLELRRALPQLDLKIWGNQWERASANLGPAIMRRPVNGVEYAKAIRAADICLAMLVEAPRDAAIGDLSTARTFEIPAAGGFMLHERTEEAHNFFAEGQDCAMFADAAEMVDKVRYYLASPAERASLARRGHQRALSSGHSYDDRAAAIICKYARLRRESA